MGYAYRVIHNPSPMAAVEAAAGCGAAYHGFDIADVIAIMLLAHLG